MGRDMMDVFRSFILPQGTVMISSQIRFFVFLGRFFIVYTVYAR